MARYDRVLIEPSREELSQALREAVGLANKGRSQRLLSWPLPDLDATLDELAGAPNGYRQWNGGDDRQRPGEGRSLGALAWWSDRLGRRHHRVVGAGGMFNRPMLENLLCPFGDPRPPLWFVYPDYVFLKRVGEQRVPVALCACGAFGTPEELGWMGPYCDACYDRAEEGIPTPPAWLDPRRATLHGQEGRTQFLAYSSDGSTLAIGTGREQVSIWDTSSGHLRALLRGEEDDWLMSGGWSADGQTLVTGSVTGQLQVWDPPQGKPTATHKAGGTTTCLAFSPDGKVVARADRQHVVLTDPSGQAIREVEDGGAPNACLAFSADGALLAGGSAEGTVSLWNVADGKRLAQIQRPGVQISSLAFSPDGSTLAVGLLPIPKMRADGYPVLLCDLPAGTIGRTLPGHGEAGVRCLAFAPDGRVLATGGDDGLLRLWDVASGRERVTAEWHLNGVCAIAFSPDGLTVASASFDGTVKLWPREVLRPLFTRGELRAVGAATGDKVTR